MTKPTIISPPAAQILRNSVPTIFLAGSIEQDTAEEWQSRLISALSDVDCVILNPRRDDWNSEWICTKDNPQFREQVEWELTGLRDADIIALYFSLGTVSPISLLEMGLHLNSDSLIIYCPPGFARKGNVDVTVAFYGERVYEDWDEWVAAIRSRARQIKQMRF